MARAHTALNLLASSQREYAYLTVLFCVRVGLCVFVCACMYDEDNFYFYPKSELKLEHKLEGKKRGTL